jgi:hypothetical protein
MLLQRSYRTNARRRGQVLAFVCVCVLGLVGILAITFDGGVLMQERRRVQAAAEASAMAAAVDLFEHYHTNYGKDPDGTAEASAQTTAKANGYDNNTADVNVLVNIPPRSGPYVGKDGYVEVIITHNVKRGFSTVFGTGRLPVEARAVARGAYPAVSDAILILNTTVPSALTVSGNGSVGVVGAPIHVNSSDAEAAVSTGGGAVVADPTDIVGGYSVSGSGPGFTGTINTGVRSKPDPLRHLPVPDLSTMTVRSTNKLQHSAATTVTLAPGVYQGGISITGLANIILQPGVYYIDGGGFSFNGQGTLSGDGVMIYNSPASNTASEGVNITGSGGGTVVLSPPVGGTYHGVTLFQNRTSKVTMDIEGNGLFDITGTFYTAKALLKVKGNGDSAVGSQYISDTLDLGGNGNYQVAYRPDLAPAIRLLGIVE